MTGLPEDARLLALVEEARVDAEALPRPVCALNAGVQEPISWAIDDFWTTGDYGLIVGEDGVMKTTLLVHILCAIAGGYRVFGRFQAVQRPVLLVSEEDPLNVLLNRAEAIIRGQGWNRTTVLGNLHIHALDGVSLSSGAWRAHLLAQAAELDLGFIGIDPLAEVAEGDENDNSARRGVVKFARQLAGPTRAGVCVVHHASEKGGPDRRKKDRIRGATAITFGSRVTYHIEKQPNGELAVECLKLSRGEPLAPFVLRPTIDSDPDNRAIWTLARFEAVTARDAELEAACKHIELQLQGGVRLSSTDLRGTLKLTGITTAQLARATKFLAEMTHRIDYIDGPNGAKLWGIVGADSACTESEIQAVPRTELRADSACIADSVQPKQPELRPAIQAQLSNTGQDVGALRLSVCNTDSAPSCRAGENNQAPTNGNDAGDAGIIEIHDSQEFTDEEIDRRFAARRAAMRRTT